MCDVVLRRFDHHMGYVQKSCLLIAGANFYAVPSTVNRIRDRVRTQFGSSLGSTSTGLLERHYLHGYQLICCQMFMGRHHGRDLPKSIKKFIAAAQIKRHINPVSALQPTPFQTQIFNDNV